MPVPFVGMGITSADGIVRRCGVDDLEAVREIHARQQNRAGGRPTVVEVATWARMMRTDGLFVYLAELDGAPLGTASMMLMPNITYACSPTAFIEAVVVVPEARRRGVARSILDVALGDARDAGCDKIQLLSHKRHAADGAHSLYTRLGFVAEAEGFRLYLKTPDVDRSR
jgi:GNAT superfamily N-acetyltransferase